ncbi:hypothetical protein GCM10027589_17240 [Actinocorallia lasiicapitis]
MIELTWLAPDRVLRFLDVQGASEGDQALHAGDTRACYTGPEVVEARTLDGAKVRITDLVCVWPYLYVVSEVRRAECGYQAAEEMGGAAGVEALGAVIVENEAIEPAIPLLKEGPEGCGNRAGSPGEFALRPPPKPVLANWPVALRRGGGPSSGSRTSRGETGGVRGQFQTEIGSVRNEQCGVGVPL